MDEEYLPADFQMKDPSKMSYAAAQELLQFWAKRQEEDMEPVFMFKAIKGKEGAPDPVAEATPQKNPLPPRKRKRAMEVPSDSESDREAEGTPLRGNGKGVKKPRAPHSDSAPSEEEEEKTLKPARRKGKATSKPLPPDEDEEVSEPEEPEAAVKSPAGAAPKTVGRTTEARQKFLLELWDDKLYHSLVQHVQELGVSWSALFYERLIMTSTRKRVAPRSAFQFLRKPSRCGQDGLTRRCTVPQQRIPTPRQSGNSRNGSAASRGWRKRPRTLNKGRFPQPKSCWQWGYWRGIYSPHSFWRRTMKRSHSTSGRASTNFPLWTRCSHRSARRCSPR